MWNPFSNPVLQILLAMILVCLAAIIAFYKHRYNYWRSKGVMQLPVRFFYGNEDINTASIYRSIEFYRTFKAAGEKFGGIYIFSTPFLVPVDLELIKNIMVKDFDYFVNRQNGLPFEQEPLLSHLFNMEGDKWRGLRAKLTPTFTSGKIKMMFSTLLNCTKDLNEVLEEHATTGAPVDAKDILGRFTTDIIANCAFGLDCNSMKDPDSEFRTYGTQVFNVTRWAKIKFMINLLLPKSLEPVFHLNLLSDDIEKFFMKTVRDIVDYREKNQVFRKDFMHLLLQLKNRGTLADDERVTDEKGNRNSLLTMDEIAAQCFVFFLAGFETSSTVMAFALLELAQNQDIQTKLRNEIHAVIKKHDGEVTYDSVGEMTYLDCVVQESLRKYPPLSVLQRECNKDYKIPGTDVVIEKGTKIGINVSGIHMDEEYYPDPEKFDPERYNEENKVKIPRFAQLGFGEGPRVCIGLRFGLLQSKIGLITVIRNYQVTLNEQTKIPFEFDVESFTTSVKGGVWLNMKKLKD